MNREPFGKQCRCNHLESEHNAKKRIPSMESMTQDYRYIIPPAQPISEFVRTDCKICHCAEFDPKKKGWVW